MKNLDCSKMNTDVNDKQSTNTLLMSSVQSNSPKVTNRNKSLNDRVPNLNTNTNNYQNNDIKGYKYFKLITDTRKYKKLPAEEMDQLFNPERDARAQASKDLDLDENTKASLLTEISQQYKVDKEKELKMKRGIIPNTTSITVPRIPKMLEEHHRRQLRNQSQYSPMKYEARGNCDTIKVRERYDKRILENLPKLKFLHKSGIKPDYEDKNIEKPLRRIAVPNLSRSQINYILEKDGKRRDLSARNEIQNSLDFLPVDKLLRDKVQVQPGCNVNKVC